MVTDAGKSNGYQILRVAKRMEWDVSIKRGKRIQWLECQMVGWFGATGMFCQYKTSVVVAVACTLISCPLLVTDTIFQRIHFVLKCRYFFKNGG